MWCTGSPSHHSRPRTASPGGAVHGAIRPRRPRLDVGGLGQTGGYDSIEGPVDEWSMHGENATQVATGGQLASDGEPVGRTFGQHRKHDPLVERQLGIRAVRAHGRSLGWTDMLG